MGFYGCVPRFIKNHASWILTALGLGGMTGTVILTAKAAPKVADEIESLRVEKWCDDVKAAGHWDDEDPSEYNPPLPELTFGEKFEIAAPHYLPAFLTGLATAACFVGAQIINGKQQAALIAAYGLLAQEFGQYREAIKTEYGEEADQKAMAIAQMETAKLKAELIRLKQENGPFLYTIATLPGVVFESTPKHMNNALYHFDRNLFMSCGSESELYSMIGIPSDLWNRNSDEYGWDTYENEITWGSPVGYFKVDQIGMLNDQPLYFIDFSIPPYKLGLNYGMEDSSCDNIDPDYRADYAERAALQVIANEIVRFDEPELYVQEPF